MKPPPPPPSSSFTFLPPPTIPFFFHSQLSNNQYTTTSTSTSSSPTNPINPPPPTPLALSLDLPSALSSLKNLILLSESTLHSISTLIPGASSSSYSLCRCPLNFHHRLQPESLFRHSLLCPSSPSPLPNLLNLESLRYPATIGSSHELIKQNSFVQTLHDPKSELCFSLEEYCDLGPNFFYNDCPGVVSSTAHDTTNRTFTLPGILSAECANFIRSGESKGFSRERVSLRLLPSELWLVRSEIEAWSDYPTAYSYSVVRAIILRSLVAEERNFLRWIIANSPLYGVIIDVAMRDHIVLLFHHCLKAIAREATDVVSLVLRRDTKELNPVTLSFKCPILVEALKWLFFQFAVLYGEVNGKFFAVNMLKEWILNGSLNSLLFPLVRKSPELPSLRNVDGEYEDSFEKSAEVDGNRLLGESLSGKVIFVSQVAAAVSALHERSLLEQKIKALRPGRLLTNYQRMTEHAYFSKWADEERQKRSNYRPLLDHDGLSWQQPRNQDMNKSKTREELLAEERDYKRRRMSYRGKKLKRSTTQVMRDIIEKYMEDITQAGGIGCLVKGSDEAGTSISEPPLLHDISTKADGRNNNIYNSSETTREEPLGFKERLHSTSNPNSTRFKNESSEDHKRRRRDSSLHLEAQRSVDRDRRDKREYYSRHSDRERSNSRSRDHHSSSGYRDSYSRSNRRREDRQQRHAYRDRRSNSVTSNEFEDRYDPFESCIMDEDEISFGTRGSRK